MSTKQLVPPHVMDAIARYHRLDMDVVLDVLNKHKAKPSAGPKPSGPLMICMSYTAADLDKVNTDVMQEVLRAWTDRKGDDVDEDENCGYSVVNHSSPGLVLIIYAPDE